MIRGYEAGNSGISGTDEEDFSSQLIFDLDDLLQAYARTMERTSGKVLKMKEARHAQAGVEPAETHAALGCTVRSICSPVSASAFLIS